MNKRVLITGASKGFGYEFVKLFAKDGYDMVLVARSEDMLREIKNEYKDLDIKIIAKDLTEKDAANDFYKRVKEMGISVDILVNNAGFGKMGSFEDIDLSVHSNMIDLNIKALTELTYLFLKDMKKKNFGKILNVSSLAGMIPGPLMAVYYASKAYVLSFSEALSEELADTNITVTALCPGAAKTNFGKVADVEDKKMFSNAMNAERVAKVGYKALMKNKRIVVPVATNKIASFLVKILPRKWSAKIAKSVAQEA
ncbi:SDR family NAD(P)-dependent oxidoreductase [Geotoga petraea]|uniref:SDR family oxidoreductase n=1 Tax=Geotoga petraea TaxID=28234 RepID=A0A4Z0VV21_9BACT|nr:SDR family oxidoreductase [Geotoga petraea]TGG87788.1 SDR family oxidoreductase [Geotoga petraea]